MKSSIAEMHRAIRRSANGRKAKVFVKSGRQTVQVRLRRILEKPYLSQWLAKIGESIESSEWLPKLFAAGRHFVGLVRALDRASGPARIHVAQWRMWL